MTTRVARYCATATFCCALASSNSALAQFPERRAEEASQPPSVQEPPPPGAPADTAPRPSAETIEDVVKRLLRMIGQSELHFGLHGYFRAPLRLSIDRRSAPMNGEAAYNIRTPWL